MELKGKIALIKYVRKISDIGLVEAKELVEAFLNVRAICCDGDTPTFFDQDIVILSLFVGEIKWGNWIIKDGKIWRNALVSYRDIVDLTKF